MGGVRPSRTSPGAGQESARSTLAVVGVTNSLSPKRLVRRLSSSEETPIIRRAQSQEAGMTGGWRPLSTPEVWMLVEKGIGLSFI